VIIVERRRQATRSGRGKRNVPGGEKPRAEEGKARGDAKAISAEALRRGETTGRLTGGDSWTGGQRDVHQPDGWDSTFNLTPKKG